MKITHIYHSGFSVELEQAALLFDWYQGELPELPKDRPLYVFVSHSHSDHYSPAVWDLKDRFPDVTYIIDRSVVRMDRQAADAAKSARTFVVEERNEYPIPAQDSSKDGAGSGVYVHTIHSTDMGVAFYVECSGAHIFHAGDLNVWYWKNEPHKENLASMIGCHNAYSELEGAEIDAAFVPLDPRLEENAPRGLQMFMECLGAKAVFPMHYWDRKDEAMAYLEDERLKPYRKLLHFEDTAEVEPF